MAGLNKVLLIGRLGKDPELKYTQSGTPVCKFSIATDESWKDSSGAKQSRTEWHNIVAWNKLAEICGEYLSKGKQVYVEGKIQTNEYTDREHVKRRSTQIIINHMVMLGSRSDGQAPDDTYEKDAVAPEQPPTNPQRDQEISDEDIPF